MVLEDQQQVLKSIRKSSDSSALQLYEQWHFNKTLVGKQLLLNPSKRLPYLDSLQEATTQLEQQLSRRAASFRNQLQMQAVTVDTVMKRLAAGEAAIEFIKFKRYRKK